MIDHETARRSFVTSLDFPLEPDDREALDRHLDDCRVCRSFEAATRADAAALRELDFGPLPIAVRANVAIAAERRDRGGAIGRWVGLAAVGALLLVAIGGGALGVGGQRGGPGDPGAIGDAANFQIAWKTEVVSLTAREFSIEAGGRTFRAANVKVDLNSDPGDATYRTLEATWQEHGVEMRLNLYFGGDAIASWVDEIRIYNGATRGEWLYARGTFFKTPLGAGWTGDQDITMTDDDGVGGTPAQVHFAGLTLTTRRSDHVNAPVGGVISVPGDSQPFGPGQPLHCSGILQMEPARAQDELLALGYRVTWRHIIKNGTYVELLKDPPPGTVIVDDMPSVGMDGQILIAIVDGRDPSAVLNPFPADCPKSAPKLTPAPPAP